MRNVVENKGEMYDLSPTDLHQIAVEVLGKEVEVDEIALKMATDPEACLMRRKSEGSPHPAQVKRALKRRAALLEESKSQLGEEKKRVADAMDALRKTVEGYISV